MDANHCPGAIMMMFEVCPPSPQGYNGVTAPKRQYHEEALCYVEHEIEKAEIELGKRAIYIVGCYQIGKENLLLRASKALDGFRTYLNPQKYEEAMLLGIPDFESKFTQDITQTRLRAGSMTDVKQDALQVRNMIHNLRLPLPMEKVPAINAEVKAL